IPDVIAPINWIYFTPHAGHENTWDESWPKVIEALAADYEHARYHKRLQVRALEWDAAERSTSYLLTGDEIKEAEDWIGHAVSKNPTPTDLHADYIVASRERANTLQRRLLAGVATALVVAIALAIIAVIQSINAAQQRDIAEDERIVAVTAQAVAEEQRDLAERNAEISQSIALAAGAREVSSGDQISALSLAVESVGINNPPTVSERFFAALAYQPGAVAILDAHERMVDDIAFGATVFATGSDDQTAHVYDPSTFELRYTLEAHTDRVTSVALNPDESVIATGARDALVILWDAATGEEIRRLQGHVEGVQALAYSPDGTQIVSAGGGGEAILWDAATGSEIRRFEGHTSTIFDVAYSPDGTQIVTGSGDTDAIVWDVASGNIVTTLSDHTDTVHAVAFSPDGSIISTGGGDNLVMLWDPTTSERIVMYTGHGAAVRVLAFTPDGTRLLTGSDDQTIILWNIARGIAAHTYTGENDFLRSLSVSPDGSTFASGSLARGDVYIWSLDSGAIIDRFAPHDGAAVTDVAVNADGSQVATASSDMTVIVQDADT
ncbi:MAG: WD40 repeat domain-containing protein, partial [Chloroflexota bacterium]